MARTAFVKKAIDEQLLIGSVTSEVGVGGDIGNELMLAIAIQGPTASNS